MWPVSVAMSITTSGSSPTASDSASPSSILPSASVLAISTVRPLCMVITSPGRVEVAAVNGPTEVVVTGALEAVEALVERLQSEGVRARRLQTAHAFHSAQMEPMLEVLERCAAAVTYAEPRRKLISNLTGAVAEAGLVTTAGYWRRQARQPVRFAAVDLATATRLAREAAARIAALGIRLRPVEGEAERLMAANLAGAAVDALRAED